MSTQTCILSDITPEQWRDALDCAIARTDFDGLFHRLYQVMDLHWYKGPDSARELSIRLFESLMIQIFQHPEGIAIRDNMTWTESGCIHLELRVYEGNYQCLISFIPHTACGSSYIHR